MKQFILNAVTPAMKKSPAILSGIFVVAAIAVGILAYSFDPYQSGFFIKFLFFGGLALCIISIISLIVPVIKSKFKHS